LTVSPVAITVTVTVIVTVVVGVGVVGFGRGRSAGSSSASSRSRRGGEGSTTSHVGQGEEQVRTGHEVGVTFFGGGETAYGFHGIFSRRPFGTFVAVHHGGHTELQYPFVGGHGHSSMGHFGIIGQHASAQRFQPWRLQRSQHGHNDTPLGKIFQIGHTRIRSKRQLQLLLTSRMTVIGIGIGAIEVAVVIVVAGVVVVVVVVTAGRSVGTTVTSVKG